MADHRVEVDVAHRGTPSECWRAECTLAGCGWQYGSDDEDTASAMGLAHIALPWPARTVGLQVEPDRSELAAALRRRAATLLLMAAQLDKR